MFYIYEIFVKIQGKLRYLWRVVDQDGEVVDVFLQARREGAEAKQFFKRLLENNRSEPKIIVAGELKRYGVSHHMFVLIPIYEIRQNTNNHDP